ncbi:putative glycoside hydrolase [Gordonia sp. VNQ95]|uniref:putative glycoside hydrolase n=1 Tax=Gordonia sp. VNQ95 TaxID=3156619 RepID=UPI0032B57C4F
MTRPRFMRRWGPVPAVLTALVLGLSACGGGGAQSSWRATVGSSTASVADTAQTQVISPEFPRTATYVLDQDKLPTLDALARYDIVVVDAEWQNRLPRSFFADLRSRHPGIILLAYVNLVDKMPRTGSRGYWQNAYTLWQFSNSTTSRFPRQWLSYTASGKPVHEWPGHVMTNLTDQAPRVNGQTYAEYAANFVVDQIWDTGLWDGVFLDVWAERIYTADAAAWDIDGDGKDEPADEIMGPGGPLDRGLSSAERIMRSRMGNAILIANGDRTLSEQRLNGRVFESFADPLADRSIDDDLTAYVAAQTSSQLHQPIVGMTIDSVRGPATSRYARARLFLTLTLLQNGWWAPMGADYGQVRYYDELDGGGLGRGYLGKPIVADPDMAALSARTSTGTGSPREGVYRRDFDHGIVLVNTTDEPVSIDLERPYRHLKGTQDPVVNNGRSVQRVAIGARDGVVLVR